MKKRYELELVLKDCHTQFAEGFSLGGLVKQEIEFDDITSDTPAEKLSSAIQQYCAALMKEHLEVRVKELHPRPTLVKSKP
jgi:hypothetical protein